MNTLFIVLFFHSALRIQGFHVQNSRFLRNILQRNLIKLHADRFDEFSSGVRLDARETTRLEFKTNFECTWPVILTNVYDWNYEKWTENLLERFGNQNIVFDIRQSNDGTVDSYEASLNDYINSLMIESTHEVKYSY